MWPGIAIKGLRFFFLFVGELIPFSYSLFLIQFPAGDERHDSGLTIGNNQYTE